MAPPAPAGQGIHHKKLGGIPVWAWGLTAVAAIALGLYFRRRTVASSNADQLASSSGPTNLGDIGNSLAGGSTAGAPSGLDPSTSDLLSNAQSELVQQGQMFADLVNASLQNTAASALDPGLGFDPGSGFDPGGGGFDVPPAVNVAASAVGTRASAPLGVAIPGASSSHLSGSVLQAWERLTHPAAAGRKGAPPRAKGPSRRPAKTRARVTTRRFPLPTYHGSKSKVTPNLATTSGGGGAGRRTVGI